MELEYILTKNPKILNFFKNREQCEIDNILISFINVLENCKTISTFPATAPATSPATTDTINLSYSQTISTNFNVADNIIINRYVLNEINKEYQEFYRNRDNLIGIFKENEKQTSNIFDLMKMPFLEKYINENCDTNLNTKLQTLNQFKCDLCNYYTCITKKALSAHQRGCKKYVGSL